MGREEFAAVFGRQVACARHRWEESARSDDADSPGVPPTLVVLTRRREHRIAFEDDRACKDERMRRLGTLFCQDPPLAVFWIAEAWMAPTTLAVRRHLDRGGGIAELTDLRREVLSIAGLQPNGESLLAYFDILRSASGEAALGETVHEHLGGGGGLFPTLRAFYAGVSGGPKGGPSAHRR